MSNDIYWFVREDPDSSLMGPYDFRQADMVARKLSQPSEGGNPLGFSELVRFVGDHGADPDVTVSKIQIKYLYIDGRRLLGGRAAAFKSGQ